MMHKTIANTDPFILGCTGLIPVRSITYIDLSDIENLSIKIHHRGGVEKLTNIRAIEALLLIKPTALEGENLRWVRHAWFVHNTVGHLSLQFMSSAAWVVRPFAPDLARRMVQTGIYWHDITTPSAMKLVQH